MFCRACGNNMENDSTFCSCCGTPVQDQSLSNIAVHSALVEEERKRQFFLLMCIGLATLVLCFLGMLLFKTSFVGSTLSVLKAYGQHEEVRICEAALSVTGAPAVIGCICGALVAAASFVLYFCKVKTTKKQYKMVCSLAGAAGLILTLVVMIPVLRYLSIQ